MPTVIKRSIIQPRDLLITNRVIKNTYALLSLTLIFSTFTAYLSIITNAPPMGMVTLLVYFGLLFLTSALSNSAWGIVAVFALTGFLGYTLGPALNHIIHGLRNGAEIIIASFGLTGAIFLTLSGYAMATKKNFNYLGGFLFVGITTAFIASLIAIFFDIPALHLAVSSACILISAGFILFETSQIIHGEETNYIMATIALYVQIFNLFVSLLHFLTALTGSEGINF
jgi:modulator of FtsH protease